MIRVVLVMARFRRDLRPVNSVKNIVDSTLLTVGAAVVSTVELASAVNDYAGGVIDVPIGAKISSIYLFVQIQQQAVNSNVDWYIFKNPGNQIAAPAVPGATGGNTMRKFILHEEKGIPGPVNNGSPPLTFKGVIKIPRIYQRWGEADRLTLRLRGAAAYDACVKCIYKFYQ